MLCTAPVHRREHSYDSSSAFPAAARAEQVSGVELREYARATIQAEVTLVSSSHFFAGRAADVSVGGIFVATYAALPVGCVVEVELTLPDGPLAVVGTVRWVRERTGELPGLGIAFELLFDEDRQRVETFCSKRAPIHFDIDDPSI